MKKIIINGKFMGDRMMGIVRYAREIVSALDELSENLDITLLVPESVTDELPLKNITCVKYGRHSGMVWEQLDLARYVRKHKGSICVNLCNISPVFAPSGITVIHDIMYKVNPSHYTTFRNKLSRYWHMFQYWLLTKRERRILTNSAFSQQELEKYYPRIKDRIYVVPCAWQHVLSYRENPQWQKAYPFLRDNEFYFSLSTLSKNKNGTWIIEAAKNNPDAVFAIAGKYYETEDYAIPSNVHMLGFVSDEDACSLMKHCKAFIHPSLYEGFGLPPLEALALGAEVISSNATALPEVLGDSVHYIDPYDYNVDIEQLLNEDVADRSEALGRFGWNKSAELLLNVLESVT